MEYAKAEISLEEVEQAKQVITMLFKKISDFWRNEGYDYISDEYISEEGHIHVELGTILGDENHLNELREKGYVIGGNEDYGFMVDNETNRKLLTRVICNRFPSAKILEWVNACQVRKISEEFLLMDIKIKVCDLKDILQD